MQEEAKRRLVGAVVIVALAVIFVPMLFEDESLAPSEGPVMLPDEPGFDDRFESDTGLPLSDPLAEPMETIEDVETLPLDLASPGAPEDGGMGVDDAPLGQIGVISTPPAEEVPFEPLPPQPTEAAPAPAPAPAQRSATPAPRPAPTPRRETAAAPPASPPPARRDDVPSWVVQVASLGSSDSANNLAGKLKKAGFTAFVEPAQVRGKQFYRVRVGPEVDRGAAERTAKKLQSQQKLDTLIQRY